MAEGQGRVLPHGTHGGKWPRAGTSHWQATLFVSYAAQPIARTVYNISLYLCFSFHVYLLSMLKMPPGLWKLSKYLRCLFIF